MIKKFLTREKKIIIHLINFLLYPKGEYPKKIKKKKKKKKKK